MTVYKLNDAPVLGQLDGNYMKFLALVVWKLAPSGVRITVADIKKLGAEGGVLFAHGHYDSFEFKIVSPAAAQRLAAYETATNRGTV